MLGLEFLVALCRFHPEARDKETGSEKRPGYSLRSGFLVVSFLVSKSLSP